MMKVTDVPAQNIPDDADAVPPGKMRVEDAREMLETFVENLNRDILSLIDGADISDEYRAGLEDAVERALAGSRKIIEQRLAPKPDA